MLLCNVAPGERRSSGVSVLFRFASAAGVSLLSSVGGRFIFEHYVAEVGADEPNLSKGEIFVNKDPAIEAFYASWAWRRCRQSFLNAKGNLCESCRKKGLIVPATQVHHKQPITPDNLKDPSITLNNANLMALCDECHAEQHRKKRWRCDPDGHVRL